MRKTMLVLMPLVLAATPAQAERYAVSCTGTSIVTTKRPVDPIPDKVGPLGTIVYVIDDEAETVHRYVPAQNLLDRICGSAGMQCTGEFSGGRVSITGSAEVDSRRRVLEFSFDRRSGALEYVLGVVAGESSIMQRWSMRCVPAEIPEV